MQVNPYESPRTVEEIIRSREAPFDPELITLIVVPIAGIVGASLFIGIMEGMHALEAYSIAYPTALSLAIAAVFGVLMAADWFIQQQRPAFASAVIGMLLASPVAFIIAFGLGLLAYDLGTKNRPGAALMGFLCYGSFFLTLSLGGWIAICLTRGRATRED